MNAEDLAAILDELGRRLGPAGEYVFRLAVQRVVIESWVTVGFGFVGLLAFAIGMVFIRRAVRLAHAGGDSVWNDHYADGAATNQIIVGGTLAVAGGAAALLALLVSGSLVNLLTPEYTALRDILAAVGGAR